MANKKRLIDANALKEYLNSLEASGGHKYYRKGVDDTLHVHIPNIVAEQPTVDAVEVVRCKGCKKGHPELAPNGGVWCAKWNHVFSEDGFCSLGEKEINRK